MSSSGGGAASGFRTPHFVVVRRSDPLPCPLDCGREGATFLLFYPQNTILDPFDLGFYLIIVCVP